MALSLCMLYLSGVFSAPVGTMVARYIPQLLAVGAVLAAYRIFSQNNLINAFVPQVLEESYDYIVGEWRPVCVALVVAAN